MEIVIQGLKKTDKRFAEGISKKTPHSGFLFAQREEGGGKRRSDFCEKGRGRKCRTGRGRKRERTVQERRRKRNRLFKAMCKNRTGRVKGVKKP